MKKPLTLLAAICCATSSYSQTTATTATTHASPSSSSTTATGASLTPEERERAITYLKETEKDFLDAIQKVSDAQWKFKAAPERWSIAETAEHIATAEEVIWGRVTNEALKSPAAPEKKTETQGKEDIIMKAVPDRSRKFQAPEILQPTGKFATRDELMKRFTETRAKEIAFLQETKEDLRSHFAEHPMLKTMDAYQWLVFNGAHCKRHTAQIEEVKTDASYPKS